MSHTFPVNGEYDITIRLSRDRNEHIEGLFESHEIDLLLDDERAEDLHGGAALDDERAAADASPVAGRWTAT